MTKLPKLQGFLDTLINPNFKIKVKESRLSNTRKNKVLKIINGNIKILIKKRK